MPPAAERIELTTSEAACLNAVKDGLDAKTKIAIETKQDLKTVARALERLSCAQLIGRAGNRYWHPTKQGLQCEICITSAGERRRGPRPLGSHVVGPAAERLLEVLDRPMRGTDLAERLGVTRQRVHQLVVKLHAQGRVRLGDRGNILHIVARRDDRAILLTRVEERILSALPDDAATTISGLVAATHLAPPAAKDATARLCEKGLVEEAESGRGKAGFRLRAKGRAHGQRRTSARRADPVPLMVKSDRVRNVLSLLAKRRQARIKDVGGALRISQASMNALMQYLKRKRLVKKAGPELSAPYELTTEGRDVLKEMRRRDLRATPQALSALSP